MQNLKTIQIAFWATTSFFALWMAFTAYAQLALPQVQQMFAHLGFPNYFRVELSIAKIVGVVVLIAPTPARVKEWAYAGFGITLMSAVIAHLAVGDSPAVFMWAAPAAVVWALSYLFYRRGSAAGPEPAAAVTPRIRGILG